MLTRERTALKAEEFASSHVKDFRREYFQVLKETTLLS